MRNRPLALGLCVAAATIVAWSLVPSVFRTEVSAKTVAQQILSEELAHFGVRVDAFILVHASKSGLDWIVTWRSMSAPSAQVGVTITPFDVDVWGDPLIPSCKDDRDRTIAAFGDICS